MSNSMMFVVVMTIMLAVLRVYFGFTVPPESPTAVDLFKDLAHVFIGGLGVVWWQKRTWQLTVMFWGLNALEVTVAVLTRI